MVSRGLARYRLKLTESLSEAMDGKFQIVASPFPWNAGLWEVDWDELKGRKGALLFREVKSVSSVDLVKALLRRFRGSVRLDHFENRELSVSEISPDMIAIHEYSWTMIKLALYGRLAGIPCVVFTELGVRGNQHGIGLFTRLCHAIGAWLTTAQVANTPAAKKPFGASHRPVFYLPYAVDTGEFSEKPICSPQAEIRILLVGQFIPRKGADLLLRALKRIHGSTSHKFRLRLVGNKDEAWIREEVAKSGLGAIVDIVGIKQGKDLVDEYHRSDIFVLPSRFDTYGVVVHEAASCGLPLLISRHAGAAEVLVKEGVNGWILDPENTGEFAARIQELIESEASRQRMGHASRNIAENWCVCRQGEGLALFLKATFLKAYPSCIT